MKLFKDNNNFLLGIGVAGALVIGGYIFVTYVLPQIQEEIEGYAEWEAGQMMPEEQKIPAQIAQPEGFVYENRFPDYYPYKSFANPARVPYSGGLPIPVPEHMRYVPPPTLGYWNPAYPNTDNRK